MIEAAGLKIFFMNFHCQWMNKGKSPFFHAGLSYPGFDAGVMVMSDTHEEINRAIKESGSKFHTGKRSETMVPAVFELFIVMTAL